MKKILFFVLVMMALASTVFGQSGSKDYSVLSVTGRVEHEISSGKWQSVTKGMQLAPSAVINTGLNSSIVLTTGNEKMTIKAMQKGMIEKLVTTNTSNKGSKITFGAKIEESNAAKASTQSRSNISTASTRASDKTQDVEWAE